ncbi:uncharacterized protein [Ptychodera flava]|uniref:uncharacterized protein n=1 Tax=Ptychodera flava TaxID=63121 RepID=UPI00396AA77E
MLQNTSDLAEEDDQGRDLLIASVLNVTDSLAKFVLSYIRPGSGPVVLDTPSISLNLESGTAKKLTNVSVVIGDGNGFEIPQVENIFADLSLNGTLNRIIKRLNKRSFQLGGKAYTNDVLSLSFTDREDNELEAKDMTEDVIITFASDPPKADTDMSIGGVYLEDDDVTHFGFGFNISQPFHAVVISLDSSDPLYGNVTMHIFKVLGDNFTEYHAHQFSLDVQFDGVHSSIFIPEHYILVTGGYKLTFTVPQREKMKTWFYEKKIKLKRLMEIE